MVAKQQLQTHGKRATPYDHVKPRVQTVNFKLNIFLVCPVDVVITFFYELEDSP